MAIVSDNGQTLLTGLSSFWNRLFSDQNLLQQFYAGTESLLGQTYLNFLETVLSSSIFNCPVFHTELWQQVVLSQADVQFIEEPSVWGGSTPWGGSGPWGDGPVTGVYVIPLPDNLVSFNYLYNQIFGPTTVLEYGLDYLFSAIPNADGISQTNYIVFFEDPFTSNNGGIINGVAFNEVNIVPEVYATGSDGIAGTLPSTQSGLFHSDSANFNAYDVNHQLVLTSPINNVSGTYAISTVFDANDIELTLISGSPVLFTPTVGVQWTLQSPPRVTQISMWAPDAQIDQMFLAENFGNLIGIFKPSSETYKLLIQGVFQYFMLGPALERLEAALNVMQGFPVAQSDSEIALAYNSTTGILTTNLDVYGPFGTTMPIRADILAAVTATPPQPFPLQAFSPLSDAFTVEDYISNPTWWWNIEIPQELLTLAPVPPLPPNVVNTPTNQTNFYTYWAGRSQVTPNMYPGICGLPVGSTGTGDVNYIAGNALFTDTTSFPSFPGFQTSGVAPGNTLIVSASTSSALEGTYTVLEVISNSTLLIQQSTPFTIGPSYTAVSYTINSTTPINVTNQGVILRNYGYVLPDAYDVPVCGDPGLICGSDEYYAEPAASYQNPQTSYPVVSGLRQTLHHNYAYQMFDRYIKWNTFQISLASGVTLAFTNEEFQDVILAGKPSYIYCFSELFP